jgi:hypothetical protein
VSGQHGTSASGEHAAGVRYEKIDVSTRSVTRAGLIVFGVSTLVALALIGYVGLQLERDDARQAPPRALSFQAERQPPLPRLQEQPFTDVRALRAQEDAVLGSYGWVDRPAGVVRIPIEEAMRLTVARAGRAPQPTAPAPSPAASSPAAPAAGGHP